MSDDRIHILSTGAIPGYAQANKDLIKIVFDIIPFNHTKFIQDEALATRIRRLSSHKAVVIFTSANAVKAVHALLEKEQPAWKIYCIGFSTRTEVLKCFKKGEIVHTAANASDLAEMIIQDGNSGVVFFCGDLRRDDLPSKLAENDVAMEELIVYKTVYLPVKVETKYSGILFFSPGAVDTFFSINPPLKEAVFFAIGKTTATAIGNYADNEIIVSAQPDKLALVSEAFSYFQEKINR